MSKPQALPYRVEYVAPTLPPDAHTLACVRYGRALPPGDDARVIDVALEPLDAVPLAQRWQSDTPVQRGEEDGVAYAHNAQVLMGRVRLDESELLHMDRAAFRAYVRMDVLMRKLGFAHWLRVWIYMAGITQGEGDDERYRQFSLGRHRALSLKPGFELNLPAATAIGTHDRGLLIYFLAGREPGAQVENPRQVSAFSYPREYGPRSPSFSRAMVKRWDGAAHLYVSGTASIVGHASRHIGDAAAQLDEVAQNIRALIETAAAQHCPGRAPGDARALGLKLYLRDRALLDALRPKLPALFGRDTPILCLEGDICRRDLLLEVEGLYEFPSG